jgi:ATP-dependent DNA helicase RecQ
VPDDVAEAVVRMLSDWARGPGGWASGAAEAPQRPAGVVTIASHTRPALIGSLGARIAEVGRMPLLGQVAYAGSAESLRVPRSNSAQRLRLLHDAFTVPPELARSLAASPGPVLLVDDFTETGWTLAVVARLLLRMGVTGVFPLVLALQS